MNNFGSTSAGFWKSLSWAKRGIIIGSVLLLISAVIVLVARSSKSEYDYLYTDLNPEDTQSISEELKKSGVIDYTIDARGIKVPATQVIPLRLKLAESGLPAQGQVGWEKFDQQDFTRTDFEQKINKIRAVQGELSRTINSIDGVISSRVHIVTPKQSLFVEDAKEPTAAIYIKTKRGVQLNQKQISGIVHLTSRSVEGLRPDMVTIIDAEGKMLTKVESDDPTTKRTSEMLTYRKTIEKEFEERVRAIVSRVVGPERVEVKVDVDVDFTTEEQTINDIDPDKVVVLSSNTTNQQMDGSGLNPTGIPGSKSNVPGEQEEITAAGSRAKSTRSSERLNYEISKTKKVRVLPVGDIRRVTAAVLVDGKQPYPLDGSQPAFEPRTKEEMKQIEDLVKSAMGYQEKRGDQVIVRNMLFTLAPTQLDAIKETKAENRDYVIAIFISTASAIALVFFFSFVVRPYFRWLSYDPERKKYASNIEEFKPDLELSGIQNIQVKEDVPFDKLSPQEQVLYLAKHEPERTTEALRMILNPHHTKS
jgi:flagellar M-ring protein FliF